MANLASPGRGPRLYRALRAHVASLLALASVAAAAALWISRGFFGPVALLVMTVAWLACLSAAWLGRADRADVVPVQRGARLLLALTLVASCAAHFLFPPGWYLDPAQPPAFRALAAAATLVAASYLAPLPSALARWRFWLLGLCFLAMGVVVLAASPRPMIDVWFFQQGAASAILDGQNPYGVVYPNIYGSGRLFGPGMLDAEGHLTVFPYPPLTFLLGAPALLLFHDVRFMLLAAMAVAAWTLRRLGKGETPELAALLVLLQPTTFFVLEQAWTEPLVLAALGGSLLAARALGSGARGGATAVGIAGGMLAAAKQYSPILAVPLAFALPPRERWKSIGIAAAVTVATLLPFVLWDPAEFWHDVVAMQVQQPFRYDALSWLAAIARTLGRPLSAAWGFLGAGALLVLLLRPGASLAQVARASAAAFLTLVLFNKQAFCNYYWLAVGLLLFATALELDPLARCQSASASEATRSALRASTRQTGSGCSSTKDQ
jgi:hypothetical protein